MSPWRVGGAGWYGKGNLLRLLQVAPAEVVSICDVDSRMMGEAAELIATRQKSGRKPRLYSDFRKIIAERDVDVMMVSTPTIGTPRLPLKPCAPAWTSTSRNRQVWT